MTYTRRNCAVNLIPLGCVSSKTWIVPWNYNTNIKCIFVNVHVSALTVIFLSPIIKALVVCHNDLQSKSMDWFLYDRSLRQERVKMTISNVDFESGFPLTVLNLPQHKK